MSTEATSIVFEVAPRPVRIASRLLVTSVVLSLADIALTLVLLPTALPAVAAASGAADATGVATAFVVVGLAVGVGLAALTLLVARRLIAGRRWARVVLVVLAVLAVPGLLVPADTTGVPVVPLVVSTVLAAGSTVTLVAGAVLTFLPASNPWFRRAGRPLHGVSHP